MKVIVCYARNRIAYSVLRSLSRAGHKCYTADSVVLPMCRFSRYSRGFFKYPQEPMPFSIWCHQRREEGFTVFPTFMESWALRQRGYLENILPPYDIIMRANNKWEVHKLCQELDIPTPETRQLVVDSVVKPTDGRGSKGRVYLDSGSVIQERVSGDAIGVGMLLNNSEVKAQFAWKRLQEFPSDGGMSVVRESALLPTHVMYAKRLLEALRWQGSAMVEFVGQHVIEVNPRLWGSLQLAVDSGVDFPKLMLDIMTEGDCETVLTYKTGVRTSWLAGCMRRRCLPRGRLEDLRWSDPLPFTAQFALPAINVLKGNGLVLDEN